MPLPKHLRIRWRYLAVAIQTWPNAKITRAGLTGAVSEAVRSLFGDTGAAAMAWKLYAFNYADGRGGCVIRVRRGEVERIRAAIATIGDVSGHAIGLRVRGVSGTVRGCEEKYLGRQPEPSEESTVVFGDAQRSATVRGEAVDVAIDDAFVGATLLDLE